jgi:hypothetical protein
MGCGRFGSGSSEFRQKNHGAEKIGTFHRIKASAAGFAAGLVLLAAPGAKRTGNFMEGYIEANGASFYYKAVGKGELVLVLHGGPGLEHGYLLPGLPRISHGHRFIFFDQRSCGKTESLSTAPA